MIVLKSAAELALMREAGRLVALAHEELANAIRPGVTTEFLDALVDRFLRKHGGIPAFYGYMGYPKNICTSVNAEVVHGIPGNRVLMEGDIVGVDIGCLLNGFYGDAARTYPVGQISPEAERLLRVTEDALAVGIAHARAGRRLSDVSHAIQAHVEQAGFSVVREFVGHGIGTKMHEPPQVPNYGTPGRGPRLRPGMTLAIEPMVNAGGAGVMVLGDNWTVVTQDGSLSAHFEHTVAITDGEPLILTLP